MKLPNSILASLPAAAVAISCLLSGCAAPAPERTVVVVHEEGGPPPPPQVEVVGVAPRPGGVWVRGHWVRRNHHWVWIRGHWRW